jgi:hypothetical protein
MKSVSVLFVMVCIAVLAASAIGTANAAIVPFNGTESSYLHPDGIGDPTGNWKSQIVDNIAVRTGDVLQFQNRWYNGYAGTADVRISYGGGQRYVCSGADEVIFYGLNYGNYYPGSTDSQPLYATVTNCSEEPNNLVINHQYVYNGYVYGCNVPTDKWTTKFHEASQEELAAFAKMTQEERNATAPTLAPPEKPTPTPTPEATPTTVPLATDRPTSVPTPGIGVAAAMTGTLAAILLFARRRGRV